MKALKNLACIVCMNLKRTIAINGQQPYYFVHDLSHFAQTTKQYKNCIVSLKTLKAIGKPLKDRFMYVITHDPFSQENAEALKILGYDSANSCMRTFEQMIATIRNNEDQQFICIGGGSLYMQFIEYTTKLYLTIVNDNMKGETIFPSICGEDWKLVNQQMHTESDKVRKGLYEYAIIELERQYKSWLNALPWHYSFIKTLK